MSDTPSRPEFAGLGREHVLASAARCDELTTPGAKPLQEDTDAMRWAGEFMQAAQFVWERGAKIDKATMLKWFADAIMCGFDESGRRYAKAAAQAKAEIERMQALNVETFRVCDAELGRQNFSAIIWAILSFLAGVVATLGTLYGMAVFHP